jgi:hypothetical protein
MEINNKLIVLHWNDMVGAWLAYPMLFVSIEEAQRWADMMYSRHRIVRVEEA